MKVETEVAYLSASELAAGYRRRSYSAREVAQAHLDRIERLNPSLHAYLTVTSELALAQAARADEALARGDDRPLLGVPVALKDLVFTKGIRTSGGSRAMWDHVPSSDATCTARLAAAGTVLLGKLALHEFANGWPVEEGPLATGRNPWNTSRVPAGSSSGSGVAVSAGLATIAIGTDTGGSIRGPANNCGVVGFKATHGRVSTSGVIPLSWSLDNVGPLCRTVEDAALALQVIAGRDGADPQSSDRPVPDYRASLAGDLHGLRVGVPGAALYRERALDPQVGAAIDAAVGVLRDRGATVREVTLPAPSRWMAIYNVLLSEAYAYHARRLRERPDGYSPGMRQQLHLAAGYTARDLVDAYRLRRTLALEMRDVLREVDVVVMPCEFHPPITFAEARNEFATGTRPPSLRSLWNLSGQPSLAVPCGFTASGLPIGMQLCGRAFDEPGLLRVAAAYQRETDWHLRRPPV